MNSSAPGLLTLSWAFPALGGLAVAIAGRGSPRTAKWTALFFSLASLAAVFVLPSLGSLSSLSESGPSMAYGIRYSLAMDGLSLSLAGLTAFLTVISILGSWKGDYSCGYWASFLFLEAALIAVFLARDLFFFYIFWEATLVPMFFIIGLWGSQGRKHAAVKFFLYTFGGSLFLLLGVLVGVIGHHTLTGAWSWDMSSLAGSVGGGAARFVFWAMVVGFGVKIPIVPFHTWLPDAHTEAPAGGSIMLAGVLLKMGIYGFLRVLLPNFHDLAVSLLPYLGGIAAINCVYGAFCAMAQSDLKRLIAYSSVAHMGFCLMGIVSLTAEGVAGGSLQMINHGLTTGALFLMVGILYERSHKRGLADFGDVARFAPWLSFFFGFSALASVGLPGLNGFVGEFMSMAGMMRALPLIAVMGIVGVTLAPAYLLPAYQAVFWDEPGLGSVSSKVFELDAREKALLWTMSVLMLAIGFYPRPWLEFFKSTAGALSV